jgi:hypothetical protein
VWDGQVDHIATMRLLYRYQQVLVRPEDEYRLIAIEGAVVAASQPWQMSYTQSIRQMLGNIGTQMQHPHCSMGWQHWNRAGDESCYFREGGHHDTMALSNGGNKTDKPVMSETFVAEYLNRQVGSIWWVDARRRE